MSQAASAAPVDVTPALADLRREVEALKSLVAERSDAVLARETPFYGWRAQDVLGHLTFVDRLAALAVLDPARCALEVAAMGEGVQPRPEDAPGQGGRFRRLIGYELDRLGPADGRERLRRWTDGFEHLAAALTGQDGNRSLQWFGRPMRLATLIAARQMEVWGYGQDVFDLFRTHRAETDRLRHVADFAVKTFRFSFANRGLAVEAPPYVELTAPSGATWTWNDPQAADRIAGPAVDFCLVATQRRHVDDTGLRVQGGVARTWMEIAQCIAGAPVSGPQPGERAWT